MPKSPYVAYWRTDHGAQPVVIVVPDQEDQLQVVYLDDCNYRVANVSRRVEEKFVRPIASDPSGAINLILNPPYKFTYDPGVRELLKSVIK